MAITYNAGTNTIQIVGYTEAVPCNFTDIYNADVAGGWGVVTKDGDYYKFNDVNVCIGDGSTTTWFKDKQVLIMWYATTTRWFDIKNHATVEFGIKDANGLTKQGVLWFVLGNGWYRCRIRLETGATIKLYDYHVVSDSAPTGNVPWIAQGDGTFEYVDCSIYRPVNLAAGISNITLKNVTISQPHAAISITADAATYTIENFRIYNCTGHIINVSTYPSGTFTIDIKDMIIGGTQPAQAMRWGYCTNSIINLIDSTEVDPSKCLASGTCTNNHLRNKKTFNLHVIDKDDNDLNGVAVEIWDSQSNKVVDTTTAADGTITEQQLEYIRHTFSSGCTYSTINYNPFTIKLTKAGYTTYEADFTLDDKTDWLIALQAAGGGLMRNPPMTGGMV